MTLTEILQTVSMCVNFILVPMFKVLWDINTRLALIEGRHHGELKK